MVLVYMFVLLTRAVVISLEALPSLRFFFFLFFLTLFLYCLSYLRPVCVCPVHVLFFRKYEPS
uniref:Uncharacterized protein n=1 Tax=Anguilla anguilla TaxID=7936 RepID=A0A0E9XUN6_ANGAN